MKTKCLEWQGSVNVHGYGVLQVKGKTCLAHNLIWRLANHGPTLRRYREVVDHICRNRRCVRLAHLQRITHGQNTLRGTSFSAKNARKVFCPNGHRLSGRNLDSALVKRDGHRRCLECKRNYGSAWARQKFGYKPRVVK